MICVGNCLVVSSRIVVFWYNFLRAVARFWFSCFARFPLVFGAPLIRGSFGGYIDWCCPAAAVWPDPLSACFFAEFPQAVPTQSMRHPRLKRYFLGILVSGARVGGTSDSLSEYWAVDISLRPATIAALQLSTCWIFISACNFFDLFDFDARSFLGFEFLPASVLMLSSRHLNWNLDCAI